MNYKEMEQGILDVKAEYIFSRRQEGISFEKIGQILRPKISKQACWKILDTYLKRISDDK